MCLPQTPGSTCSPAKASPDTGWPWKAKCHFKVTNASYHRFWARPKPWSEPSLGLGETKFKPRMKSRTSSLSCNILVFPAHHRLLLVCCAARQPTLPISLHLQHSVLLSNATCSRPCSKGHSAQSGTTAAPPAGGQ